MEVRKNRNGVNKMSLYIGTNYHPHDWPKERWEKDFQLMKEAGFDTVRLGHLCWDSYERRMAFIPSNGLIRLWSYA